jgi:serine/threonine protein kinase
MEYTLLRTARGEYDLKDGIWQSISPEAKDLITQLLQTDHNKRIGLEEALNHPWF